MFNAYINIQSCVSQTQQNFIILIFVLGRHVSILTESSSGTSKKIDSYLKCLKLRCGVPNSYIRKRLGPQSAFLNILSKNLFS